MIGRLTGIMATINKTPAIIDVHGVGYSVHITQKEAKTLAYNKPVTLHIHTHVREDSLDLYGFSDQNDLWLFELLLTVSGIGPKTGLSIIERGAQAIQHAVLSADTDFFTTIPRLGKKNAQKIIIELKTKLGGIKDIDLTDDESETKQILDALTDMGFDRKQATNALRDIDPAVSAEQKIKTALKALGKHH